MSQCLRCSKPCRAAGVFCDECRSLLQMGMQQVEAHVSGKPLERISDSCSIADVRQKSSSLGDATYASGSEQAVDKPNIAQRNRRMPRASRLTAIHDISADIQRESTPKLKASEATARTGERPLGSAALKTVERPQKADSDRHQPYVWPWLQDTFIEESDSWATRTDPLKSRHLPNKAEAARIEKEDIRRAQAERRASLSGPRFKLGSRRMRIALSVLAIVILLALTLDLVLIFLAFVHPGTHVAGGMPMLTLSPSKAKIGQSVRLHISNFPPTTDVLVTHDVGEAIHTNSVSPLIKVGSSGVADVELLIDGNWGPGFHRIEAEDVTTRYTTSTTLQVIGSGSTKPSHLLLDNTFLNMGSDVQYANTVQALLLRNSGGGSISWVASSNKPWLLTSPTQGTFSSSQAISVAVARTNLKPGDYTGTITISSNVGAPAHVKIGMTVLPLSTTAGPVLVVAPAVFSFVSTDGGADPDSQLLTISNPGSQALNWSLSSNTPTSAGPSSPTPISTTNWLSTDVTAGTVAAHSTGFVHIIVHSQNVLPGTYTDTLVFAANQGTLNSPQEVPVALTVQPRCGLTTNTGGLLFIAVLGQANPGNQALGLSASAGCSDTTRWQATYTANWLTLAPSSGQLKGTAVASVGVNVGSLNPGTYNSIIAFSAGQSTQNVNVQLIVQAPPAASTPIMGITAANLNFTIVQGQANPPGRVVTITNNGGSTLYWHSTPILLGTSWLGAAPTGGVIPAGQTGQLTVRVDTSQLTPATYMGQIILNGTDATGATAAGSPQTIAVNLEVQTPCALAEPTSSALNFSTQGAIEPMPQTVTLVAAGNCGWPLKLHASITNGASWLTLKLSDHVVSNGQLVSILAMANPTGLAARTYTAQISIDAIDGAGIQVQGSPKTITVTLTVT